MDFGDVVSLSATTSLDANETRDQEKLYGSDGGFFFKQEFLSRGRTNIEGDLRGLKLPKTESFDDFSASKAIQRNNSLLRSDSFDSHGSSQMLCFSSPNSVTFPFYHHPSSNTTTYARNAAAYGSKGSFTPSQWMELEHQALIYKYIHANVPIPTSLLTPIRKTLDSAGFSAFVGLRPSTYGWGAYQLGFSSSTDPEPGRCRRTDGKKWRCARDALADHKYCDRHMNRGRHRSRKPVEGQSGHSVSGTTNSTAIKKMPPMASSTSATVVPRGAAFDNLGLKISQHLCNTPSGVASQSSASGPGNRSFMDNDNLGGKYQDIARLSMISSSLSLKDNQYPIPKPQDANQELCRGEFGQVCSDSLLNPFNKSSSLVNCSSYGTSEESKDTKSKPQNSLHQFIADWPNNQSESSWQDINMHSERTQLSISIPSAISDFMSSTSSPTNEKLVSSPPKHSQDLEATQMRLQVGNIPNDRSHCREANWIPVNWESSMEGGPLAEVLNNTHSNSVDSKTPSLNLMTGGWESSPYFASSPTGVLQKASFVSSSNSSAGSSPRAATDISKAHKGASLCSNVLISSLTNPVLPNM